MWWLIGVLLWGALEAGELKVTGTATLQQPADWLVLRVGVVTREAEAEKAVRMNAEKMASVLQALQAAGVSEKEWQTSHYTIAPQYSEAPLRPSPNWRAEIVGYEVRNTVTVESAQVGRAGEWIDALVKRGGNSVEEVTFTLQEEDQGRARAIQAAVKQARLYAEAAVNATGEKLGPIKEIEISPSYNALRVSRMEKHALASDAGTALSPGDVDISASVHVTYHLGASN